jgi:hypothetical protein
MSDTPRMKAAQMAAMEHMTGDVYRVGCDLERELNAANERIKRLEEALDKTTKIAARHIQQLENGGDEAIYKTNLFDRESHWTKAKEAKL